MTSSTRGKTLFQLGLCLLLVTGMAVWSTTWSAPAAEEGLFEQLGDRSPLFLLGIGDSPSGDTPYVRGETHPFTFRASSALVAGATGSAVTHPIRIASYPVLPQAPPALT
ncbi:hypothetical protein [Kineobactrum salinum]|uniref:Uncharacterized protein n=1 Tax=Kineobactrum salinum TaxID=2708301 RepID=A0A6C0U4I6_9GAMM|nr:hypothetical protein [Kineobactrum salinum]QIB64364.1 hypothetical protein G3T16_02020 [Kineobactrum salinum]